MGNVLVTGSTKGIGKAIGYGLLNRGYKVAFNYARDAVCARDVEEDLCEKFGVENHKIFHADLSNVEACRLLVDSMMPEFSPLEYLVLNTSTTWRGSLGELETDEWMHVLNCNLTVPLFLTKYLSPYMAENGSILFIGSVLGQFPHALSIPYGVSKAGIHYLTKSLVKEFSPRRIRVNCLAPGFVDTEWQKNKPAEIRSSIEDKIALHRFADVDEIAAMACAILENTYMNGSVVNIDGGYCYQ